MTVTFDRPCTLSHAVAQSKNCIHGVFYPDALNDTDPGQFKVKSITRKPGRQV